MRGRYTVVWLSTAEHQLVEAGAADRFLALATNALLVSANLQDFEQLPGLRVEDWLR